jgi:hypothetical protein
MDQVKKHFEEEAHEFDEIIRHLAPYYDEMLDALSFWARPTISREGIWKSGRALCDETFRQRT